MAYGDSQELHDRIQALEEVLRSTLNELENLRKASDSLADKAGTGLDCFKVLDVMGMLKPSPESEELLDTIISVATVSVEAEGGSILLLDETGTQLVFSAVHGEKADELKHFKVAIGQGIAGFVVASGQPLNVQDLAENAQWNRSISEAIQFATHSILAVPIVSGSSVLGVLETVNKVGGGGFSEQDMELLTQFATIVGAAVEKRHMFLLGQSLLAAAKERLGATDIVPGSREVVAAMASGLERASASHEYRMALEIATRIVSIVTRRPQDAQLCLDILNAVHARLEFRPLSLGGSLRR